MVGGSIGLSKVPRTLTCNPTALEGFPGGASGKESTSPAQPVQETQVRSLGQEDHLEEEMATHSSILAWRTPWTEEPGGL